MRPEALVAALLFAAAPALAQPIRILVQSSPLAGFQYYGGKILWDEMKEGDRLTLVGPRLEPVLDFTYQDDWHPLSDGLGFSLVNRNPGSPGDYGSSATWRNSTYQGGSPGANDPVLNLAPVVVNEVLANTVLPAVDLIELHNPTTNTADISGWFLTDDLFTPKKFRIPDSTTIAPGGFIVFSEADFNPAPGALTSFALGSGPWEGIGTGWAFAPQGGVTYSGPMSATKVSLATDNTEAPNPSGMAVPSIFNGDFEEGALNRSWWLQYSAGGLVTRLTGDLPGWSFHGGSFAATRTAIDGDRLVTLPDGTHAVMLDNNNYRIEHNRMVVPDWAEFLSVDVKVLTGKPGEKLLVRGYLADSSVPVELGSIALDSTGTNFQSYTFQVPTSFRGAGRLLEFSMSNGASADAEVLLDHVQFTKGLITDSTLDPSDKAVFFTDTTTGPTTGLSNQWVDITNPFSQAFTVTITTDPNTFLVVTDPTGQTQEVTLSAGEPVLLPATVHTTQNVGDTELLGVLVELKY